MGTEKQDFEKTLNAAQEGSAEAMYSVGSMCYRGYGYSQDYEKALNWYLAAAKTSEVAPFDSVGQLLNDIGTMYYEGKGTEKDVGKAFEWFSKAASKGHEGATLIICQQLFTNAKANRARQGGDNDALRQCNQALTYLQHMQDNTDALRLMFDINLEIASIMTTHRKHREAFEYLDVAEKLEKYNRFCDEYRKARLHEYRGIVFLNDGKYKKALSSLQLADGYVGPHDSSGRYLSAWLAAYSGLAWQRLGKIKDAELKYEQALELAQEQNYYKQLKKKIEEWRGQLQAVKGKVTNNLIDLGADIILPF
jgi:TPR repeat protein